MCFLPEGEPQDETMLQCSKNPWPGEHHLFLVEIVLYFILKNRFFQRGVGR